MNPWLGSERLVGPLAMPRDPPAPFVTRPHPSSDMPIRTPHRILIERRLSIVDNRTGVDPLRGRAPGRSRDSDRVVHASRVGNMDGRVAGALRLGTARPSTAGIEAVLPRCGNQSIRRGLDRRRTQAFWRVRAWMLAGSFPADDD